MVGYRTIRYMADIRHTEYRWEVIVNLEAKVDVGTYISD